MIFGSGLLVYLAGRVEVATGNIPLSWTTVLGASGGIFLALAAYHAFILPRPTADEGRVTRDERESGSFGEVFAAYFRQERIGVLIAFILFYRLGEAMLLKLARC